MFPTQNVPPLLPDVNSSETLCCATILGHSMEYVLRCLQSFVYMVSGLEFRQPVFKYNTGLIRFRFPVSDWHNPFFYVYILPLYEELCKHGIVVVEKPRGAASKSCIFTTEKTG